ncbi:MAG TPA: DUF4416 family protein [Firmicutes bacterium]|nr:DUF4416 family protein [Bacillota bacterium]
MGKIKKPREALLFCGLLYASEQLFEDALQSLSDLFGPLAKEARGFPFKGTDYYQRELGEEIYKGFLFFEQLIPMDVMASVKMKTNELEERLSLPRTLRSVNLDPGYLDLSKVMLATTKDRAHRLYLRDGIFGEVEYTYCKNSYTPCPWTYPDYRQSEYISLFNEMRFYYQERLRQTI